MISLETSRHTQNREDSRIEIHDDLKSYNREVRVPVCSSTFRNIRVVILQSDKDESYGELCK